MAARRAEEASTITEACAGLQQALTVFTAAGPPPAGCASMEGVSDLFRLALSVLRSDTSPGRMMDLVFDSARREEESMAAVLLRYITAPLAVAPGARSPADAQKQFTELRVAALRSLLDLVSICVCEDGKADEEAASLSRRCVGVVARSGGCNALCGIASAQHAHVPEEVRVPAAECVFTLSARSADARSAIAADRVAGSVARLERALLADPSPAVQNSLAACLRELATDQQRSVAEAGLPRDLPRLLGSSISDDAVALVLETQAELLPAFQPPVDELVPRLVELLARVTDGGVLRAASRLVDVWTRAEHGAPAGRFAGSFVVAGGCSALLGAAMRQPAPDSSVAMAARALRHVVELAPPAAAAGGSLLLKAPDQFRAILLRLVEGSLPDPADLHGTILCVELSIVAALIASQSVQWRRALHSELVRMGEGAERRLVAQMQQASAEYFAGIRVVDATGWRMDRVRCVEWDSHWRPSRDWLSDLLALQESRQASLAPPPAQPDEDGLVTAEQQQGMTFFVLAFSVLECGRAQVRETVHESTATASPKVAAWLQSQSVRPDDAAAAASRSSSASARNRRPRDRSVCDGSVRQRHRSATPTSRRSGPLRSLPPNVAPPATHHPDDAALALACSYARHFSANAPQPRRPTPRHAAVSPAPNPWRPVEPQVLTLRTWSVADLKKGDLFTFAVPHDAISVAAIEAALFLAKRHLKAIGESWQTTPQRAKGRRWFLFDMQQHIMPRIQDDLLELARLCARHGAAAARTGIDTLRRPERELGEAAVTPANLPEVLQQLRYYFSRPRPPPSSFVPPTEPTGGVASTLYKDPATLSDGDSSDSDALPAPEGRLRWDPQRAGPGVVLAQDLRTAGCRRGDAGASVITRHAVVSGQATWDVAVLDEGVGAAAGALVTIGVAAGGAALTGDPTHGADAWGLYGAGCALHHNDCESGALRRPLRKGDRVHVALDADRGTVRFRVNKEHVGEFRDLPRGTPLRPCVTFFATGTTVRIVGSNGF
eukprot:TRINITY_DN11568_c0_g1_i1.p1 TRINITY_DN11568_c0_g1~~TRINITY_DN11568_c0_g1_i1.p1  ORF type:complete len:1008 (+),score=308.35 TRINITY_DN11568_c0_g1_i1:67-3090(+)